MWGATDGAATLSATKHTLLLTHRKIAHQPAKSLEDPRTHLSAEFGVRQSAALGALKFPSGGGGIQFNQF